MNKAAGVPDPGCGGSACLPASRAELRRGRIIDTARTLFADNGFHNTGIAQIAKQSGVLVGQIYRDFASKEDIVAAIVARDLETVLADDVLCRAMGTGDAAAVRDWIRLFVAGKADHDYALVAEIIAEASRNERVATIFRTCHDKLRTSIGTALAVLAPEPHKARRRAMLAEVILTISGGVFQRRLGHIEPVEPALIAALTDAIDREIDVLIDA